MYVSLIEVPATLPLKKKTSVVQRTPAMHPCKIHLITCVWIENDNELYTLEDLRRKMLEDSVDSEVYGVKRLKQKLQEKYKDFVFFAEICGRKNVVCFRNMASWIIRDKWYERKTNAEDEAKRIVETAVKNHQK